MKNLKQNKLCDECKEIIEDDHNHYFYDSYSNTKSPACHSCFDCLVGCEVHISQDYWS